MTNISRNQETIEDLLADVAYQMTLAYAISPNSSDKDKREMRIAHVAMLRTIQMIGEYWAGIHGPQIKDVKIADIRSDGPPF